ncbi:hypothetical protein J2S53_001422 [Actinopolyspora lacussalsi]|nr:hypothetical protein [Actinopolyspora lacussalsi]
MATSGKDSQDQSEASQRLERILSPEAMDALIADAETTGTPIDGTDGLLNQITKAVLERSLETEMTDHLGYDKGDPAGYGSGNFRNGHSGKTISTTAGPVEVSVPRDRESSFEPKIAGETFPAGRAGRGHDPVVVRPQHDHA